MSETPSCVLSEIFYGGSLGRVRNPHKILRRSEVVRGGGGCLAI